MSPPAGMPCPKALGQLAVPSGQGGKGRPALKQAELLDTTNDDDTDSNNYGVSEGNTAMCFKMLHYRKRLNKGKIVTKEG